MNNSRENGFSAIEVALVILVVVLLGVIGWLVASRNNKSSNSASNSTAVNSTKSENTTKYFTISQWAVRAPYNGNLTLEYSPPQAGGDVYLSSAQLDQSDPNCSLYQTNMTGGYGGYIERLKPTDQITTETGQGTGQSAAQYYNQNYNQSGLYMSHIGNYYYLYVHPQGLCAQNSANIQNQTVSVFENIVDKLQAVPSN